jgi:carboxypeptidase Taq
MDHNGPYGRLEELFGKIGILGGTLSLLHWDMSTMMPDGGASARSGQITLLKGIVHELITAPEVAGLLDGAAGEDLDPWSRANLREMRRDWVRAAALPADLVKALAEAESACEMMWREARRASDFKLVLPYLETLLGLVRHKAQAMAEALGVSAYDALLDQYEPDGRAAEIDAVFADLESFLPNFLARVTEAQARRPAPALPPGPFPVERQRAVAMEFMATLGFDFNCGRLDTSHHPFCGGTPEDVRVTTRYDEADFTSALMGVLHETGHALYEFGLPEDWRGQPVGRARGMVLHESQSLLMEMRACRSREFIGWAAPRLAAAFGGAGPVWEADNLYRLGLKVEPGFIRVDADEVTYPAHVIIRYRLERALIEGRMDVACLPDAWDEGYKRLLGLVPPDYSRGCLQDIHWFGGAWGYFPTYTLGAMAATQLFDAAWRAEPAIPAAIANGDFRPLRQWLRTNVHSKGSLLSTRELLIEATGRPLDAAVFKAHLARRYLAEA